MWPLIGLILLLAVTLPPLDLSADTVTDGDHAANSLLIVKAKSFQLFHGNHSRVGFYHPGPYFMYVMAAGEWILFDLFGVVNSPEAAHRIAIAISNLVLLGIVFNILNRFSENRALAAMLTLFGLGVILSKIPVLNSVWPPHMYIIPAMVFTISIWDVIRGEPRSLWSAALGAGILVHGHASNLGLVPIMMIGALAGSIALRARAHEKVSISAVWNWLKPHLPAATIVFLIFVTPYLLQTILFWPGETPKYFRQSGHVDNTLAEAVRYSRGYWGIWTWALVGGLLALAIRPLESGDYTPTKFARTFHNDLYAFVLTLMITGGAIVFYALKGIDTLSLDYIGLWYLGAVSGLISILLTLVAHHGAPVVKPAFICTLALATVLSLFFLKQPLPVGSQLNNDGPSARSGLAAIQTDSGGENVVISLDKHASGWWRGPIGFFDMNARRNLISFCAPARDWRITFHEDLLCTPEKINDGIAAGHIYYFSERDLDPTNFTLVSTFRKLNIYRVTGLSTLYAQFNTASESASYIDALIFGAGWSRGGQGPVLQVEEDSILHILAVASKGPQVAELMFAGFIPDVSVTQYVEIFKDGQAVESFSFSRDNPNKTVEIYLPPSSKDNSVEIRIRVQDRQSPEKWGQSGDKRELGVILKSVSINPIAQE